MPIPDLLRELLLAAGPSGNEEPAARVWRDAASSFAEVDGDTLGTSFARVRAGEGAPTLALVGHIDEIGMAITNIGENGMLSYATIGGFSAETLTGQRVRIAAAGGEVRGVIGRRRITADGRRGDRPSRVEHDDLHIDIGARSREEAASAVRVGDAAVWDGEPFELPNGRVVSRALDNRLGAYVALEAARRVSEAGDAEVDVVAVAAVAEEVGFFGAQTAAFSLRPDVALAIDVTHATDIPGGNAKLSGKVELGGGPTIERGPMIQPARLRAARPCRRRGGDPARVRGLDARDAHGRRPRARLPRRRPDRARLDPAAVHALAERALLARRRRGRDPPRRRVCAPAHPRAELRPLASRGWPPAA